MFFLAKITGSRVRTLPLSTTTSHLTPQSCDNDLAVEVFLLGGAEFESDEQIPKFLFQTEVKRSLLTTC